MRPRIIQAAVAAASLPLLVNGQSSHSGSSTRTTTRSGTTSGFTPSGTFNSHTSHGQSSSTSISTSTSSTTRTPPGSGTTSPPATGTGSSSHGMSSTSTSSRSSSSSSSRSSTLSTSSRSTSTTRSNGSGSSSSSTTRRSTTTTRRSTTTPHSTTRRTTTTRRSSSTRPTPTSTHTSDIDNEPPPPANTDTDPPPPPPEESTPLPTQTGTDIDPSLSLSGEFTIPTDSLSLSDSLTDSLTDSLSSSESITGVGDPILTDSSTDDQSPSPSPTPFAETPGSKTILQNKTATALIFTFVGLLVVALLGLLLYCCLWRRKIRRRHIMLGENDSIQDIRDAASAILRENPSPTSQTVMEAVMRVTKENSRARASMVRNNSGGSQNDRGFASHRASAYSTAESEGIPHYLPARYMGIPPVSTRRTALDENAARFEADPFSVHHVIYPELPTANTDPNKYTTYPDTAPTAPNQYSSSQYPGQPSQYPGQSNQYPDQFNQYPDQFNQYPGPSNQYSGQSNQYSEPSYQYPPAPMPVPPHPSTFQRMVPPPVDLMPEPYVPPAYPPLPRTPTRVKVPSLYPDGHGDDYVRDTNMPLPPPPPLAARPFSPDSEYDEESVYEPPRRMYLIDRTLADKRRSLD